MEPDVEAVVRDLKAKSGPTPAGPVTVAVLDDTCGNLIQIQQVG